MLLNSTVDTHLQSPYHWLFRSEDKQTLEVMTRWTATNNAVQKTAKVPSDRFCPQEVNRA